LWKEKEAQADEEAQASEEAKETKAQEQVIPGD
jgi:hypothetical protein